MAKIYSTDTASSRQESHERQFRYFVMPQWVCEQVSKKQITAGEAFLLGTIDSFVRADGRGCYASNGYLSTICGITTRQVQNQLAKLIKLNLLVQQGGLRGEQRFLWPSWVTTEQTPTKSISSPHEPPFVHINKEDKTTTRKPAASRRGSLLSVDGFLPSDTTEDDATKLAQRLRDCLASRYRLEPWSKQKWAGDLRKLIKQQGHDVVNDVLTWYEGNSTARPLYSAAGFARYFDTLRAKAIKPQGSAVPALALDEAGQKMFARAVEILKDLKWPKGSADQLVQAVAASLAAYRPFYKRLRAVREGKDRKLSDFAARAMGDLCWPPQEFMVRWFKQVNKQVAGWTDWSGDLNHFIWRVDHKRFVADGSDLAAVYGNVKLWQKLLEAIT